jgi:hypothetical protein
LKNNAPADEDDPSQNELIYLQYLLDDDEDDDDGQNRTAGLEPEVPRDLLEPVQRRGRSEEE